MIAPLGLMGISLALLPAAGAEDKKPATKPAAAPAKSSKPAPAGMIAVKDPDTGQFRAPTADEAAALRAAPTSQQTVVGAAPQTFAGPAGSTGLVLDDSTTVYAVATKKPDGTISFGEVTGGTNAKKVVTNPKPDAKQTKTAAKEVANDR
jgi:hypothetical protein